MLNSVMVVDDESSIRSAVEQWLSLSGFEVQLFSRAEECLAALPAHFPGVILSDVRMPGASGLDLLRRTRGAHPELPFLLVTAYADVREIHVGYLFEWLRGLKRRTTISHAEIDLRGQWFRYGEPEAEKVVKIGVW